MKKVIIITICGMMIGVIGFALMMGLTMEASGGESSMEQNLVLGLNDLAKSIKDDIQFKYNVYSSDGNISDMRYGYKANNITITTPVNTICEWDINKPLRHCYQDIEIEYMRNLPIASLSQSTINFTGQIANKQMKGFKFTLPNSLSKGNNYTARIEFDYPANTGEEWNFSLNAFGYEWKIDPEISACSLISSAGVYTLTTSLTNAAGSGACMNITVSDVELDCVGWNNWIDGNDTASTVGIKAEGLSAAKLTNVSIRNCNVTDWANATIHDFTDNSSIENISAISNAQAAYIKGLNNTLRNSNLSRNTLYAVSIVLGNNNTIVNNSIVSPIASTKGIYLSSSNNNTIENNTVKTTIPLFYLTNSKGNTISNTTFSVAVGTCCAMASSMVSSSTDNVIKNSLISSSGDQSDSIYINSNNNTVINTTISSVGSLADGINIASANNITVINNTITSGGSSGGSSTAIAITNSMSAVIKDNTMTTSFHCIAVYGSMNVDYYNHTIDESNTVAGYPVNYTFNKSGITISDRILGELFVGISSNVTINNLTFPRQTNGILIRETNDSTIINSSFKDARGTGSFRLETSNNNIIKNVSVNSSGCQSTYNCYNIYLDASHNNSFSDINVGTSNGYYSHGFYILHSKFNTISNSTIKPVASSGTDEVNGIRLYNSSFNNVTNCTISDTGGSGVYLTSPNSGNNTFTEINSSGNARNGFYIISSTSNQIINSTIIGNKRHGINLQYANFNNVTGTRIENNSASGYAGIYIYSHATTASSRSSNNSFWNNIINNTPNIGNNTLTYGINYTNYFNTTQAAGTNIVGGAIIGGNYWSDGATTDADANGIVDVPYVINSSAGPVTATNMTDALPLNLTTAISDSTAPIVTIISPTNTTYSSIYMPMLISFNVSLNEAGSSCLLELDKTPNVTMTKQGNNLNFNITNITDAGSHNARFYCNDTSNNMNYSGMNNVTFNIVSTGISACSSLTSAGIYTLTAPINNAVVADKEGCININNSNVWFDCQNWNNWISGISIDFNYGIYVNGSSSSRYTNVSVKNCNLTNWSYGIMAVYMDNSTFDNISLINYLSSYAGFRINDGFNDSSSNIDIINRFYASYNGIELNYVYNSTFVGMNISNVSDVGIGLLGDGNQIINSSITNTTKGILLYGIENENCLNNNITGTRIENNSIGIKLNSYTLVNNEVANNSFWNNIMNNTPNGGKNIGFVGGEYEKNYTNYFNTTKVSGINIYNSTSLWIGGNYWSDYTGVDADNDGIGDTPYVINETYMIDYLPLVVTASTASPEYCWSKILNYLYIPKGCVYTLSKGVIGSIP